MKIIFECFENQNNYKEEIEFDNDTTDEEIEEEWRDWVWNQVIDNFTWYKKEE